MLCSAAFPTSLCFLLRPAFYVFPFLSCSSRTFHYLLYSLLHSSSRPLPNPSFISTSASRPSFPYLHCSIYTAASFPTSPPAEFYVTPVHPLNLPSVFVSPSPTSNLLISYSFLFLSLILHHHQAQFLRYPRVRFSLIPATPFSPILLLSLFFLLFLLLSLSLTHSLLCC